MTMRTLTITEAPEVVFVSRRRPNAESVAPIVNQPMSNKPMGGLWTCPTATEDNWFNWCSAEMPEWLEDTKEYVLTPRPGTRVAVIDSLEDLKELLSLYPTEPIEGFAPLFGAALNFEAMARDFDGVWLTSEGQWRTRLTYPVSLYGWDLECILFFRWVF